MDIYSYAKLSEKDKEDILKHNALLLDQYMDGEKTVYVYFLDGFFVEVTMKDGNLVDTIPYLRGYKVDKNIPKSEKTYNIAA